MELLEYSKDHILVKENAKYFKATWQLEGDTPTLTVIISKSKDFKGKLNKVTKSFDSIKDLYIYLILFFGLSSLNFELNITNGAQEFTYNRLCLFIGGDAIA